MNVRRLAELSREFEQRAEVILASVDSSPSRVITIEAGYARLAKLSLQQDALVREAFSCVSAGLFRAAHVMAWAAFIDFVYDKLYEDDFAALRVVRPNWTLGDRDDLREYPDSQVVESLKLVGLCKKDVCKSLSGNLSVRNECAHPTGHVPDLSETLGYVSGLLNRIRQLQGRSPKVP